MSAQERSDVFDETYQDYLRQIGERDPAALCRRMGVECRGDALAIPFFGRIYLVSARGIADEEGEEPVHALKVVLSKYVLLYPEEEPEGTEWASYKDFRDAAPFAASFRNHTERAVARRFTGRKHELLDAARALGGRDPGLDWNYEVILRFDALPRIPMLLLFNDADEEFPAECRLLFERRAVRFLDVESLAITGWLLADKLGASLGAQPSHM